VQLTALTDAHDRETARLGNELVQSRAELAMLTEAHAKEIARLRDQLAQSKTQATAQIETQAKEIVQQTAELADLKQRLEHLTEQHRLQTIELKWAVTKRENLNVKLASHAASQAPNRRAAPPGAQPLAARPADAARAERSGSPNGGPAPEQRRDAAAPDASKAADPRNGGSAKRILRELLRKPHSYLKTMLRAKLIAYGGRRRANVTLDRHARGIS